MQGSKVIDRRSVKLQDVLRADYIPFLGGRPHRETVIGHEDMVNLSIALNLSRSLEEFVAMM